MTIVILPLPRAEVLAISAAQSTRYSDPKHAALATRVEVVAALRLKNPSPCSEIPSHLEKHSEKRAFSRREYAAIVAHQKALVHEDDARDYADAIERGDPNFSPPHCADAHHFVQKRHDQAISEATDRALEDAGLSGTGTGTGTVRP